MCSPPAVGPLTATAIAPNGETSAHGDSEINTDRLGRIRIRTRKRSTHRSQHMGTRDATRSTGHHGPTEIRSQAEAAPALPKLGGRIPSSALLAYARTPAQRHRHRRQRDSVRRWLCSLPVQLTRAPQSAPFTDTPPAPASDPPTPAPPSPAHRGAGCACPRPPPHQKSRRAWRGSGSAV